MADKLDKARYADMTGPQISVGCHWTSLLFQSASMFLLGCVNTADSEQSQSISGRENIAKQNPEMYTASQRKKSFVTLRED